jgi:major cell surface glycoprotein (TIGR04216 family)
VNTTQKDNPEASVRGRLTTITTTKNQSQPGIKLTTVHNISKLNINLTIQHQAVQEQTEYDISAVVPGTDSVSVSQFFVRPIGPDNRAALSGDFNRAAGRGFIYPNATIYRGERDISFRGELTSPLRGSGGNNDGVLLRPPIPTDIATGTYSVDGRNDTASIQLQEPEITTLRIENSNAADVTGGTIYTDKTDTATVVAQSNFEDAEQLELIVRNDDGTDITEELIDTAPVRPETESGRPVRSISPVLDTTATTQSTQPIQSIAAPPTAVLAERSSSPPGSRFDIDSQSKPATNAVTELITARQAQLSETTGPNVERTVNQSDIEPGETVAVTLKATVGSNNELSIVESFSPNVQEAEITSSITGETDATPTIRVARSSGLLYKVNDVPSGTRIELNYQIETKPIDETYVLDGSAGTDGVRTKFDTTEIVAGSGGAGSTVVSGGQVQWQLDVSDIDTQTLTVEVTGSDDLDTNEAQSSAKLTSSDASPTISVSDSQPSRGNVITVSISDGVYGSIYTDGIDAADIKNDASLSGGSAVFRNVGTTQNIGVVTQNDETTSNEDGTLPAFVYAQVKIDTDDGTAETKIETDTLDEITSLKLLSRDQSPSALTERSDIIAERDLSIGDRKIILSGPDGYIPGDETTLRGNADSGVDTAIMYVRSIKKSQYKLVDLDDSNNGNQSGLSVSGKFNSETVLSDGDAPGNRLLSFPGTYEIAVQSKASLTETHGGIPRTISRPEMLAESPSLHTIQVRQPNVTLEEPGINGVVAKTQDFIEINGSIKGQDTALLAAIDDRGTIETKIVEKSTLDQVSLPLNDLSAGLVTIYVVSAGRDGRVGDGTFNDVRITGEKNQFNRLQNQLQEAAAGTTNTGDQLRARLRAETDLDTASDDQLVRESIQIVPPSIEINAPAQNATIEPESPIQVSGSTTVESYSGDLSVLLITESTTRARTQVQQWGDDGWGVTLPASNLTPGRYQIKASIDRTTTTRMIKVASENAQTQTQAPRQVLTQSKSTAQSHAEGKNSTNTDAPDQTPTRVPSSALTEESVETTAPSSQIAAESRSTDLDEQSRANDSSDDYISDVMTFGGFIVLTTFILMLIATRQL